MAVSSPTSPPGPMSSFGARSEMVLAVGLLGLVAILLVPLPGWIIDILLALNFAMTVLLLLITLGSKQPLDFSVFPSLLLILTLFRLTLNISTTRAILLHGDGGAIQEIAPRNLPLRSDLPLIPRVATHGQFSPEHQTRES